MTTFVRIIEEKKNVLPSLLHQIHNNQLRHIDTPCATHTNYIEQNVIIYSSINYGIHRIGINYQNVNVHGMNENWEKLNAHTDITFNDKSSKLYDILSIYIYIYVLFDGKIVIKKQLITAVAKCRIKRFFFYHNCLCAYVSINEMRLFRYNLKMHFTEEKKEKKWTFVEKKWEKKS